MNLDLCIVKDNKHILVAPLNWGLGHATRCIPIVRALLLQKYKVTLASDGQALLLLRKEFPQLDWVELPSYNICYPKNGNDFRRAILKKLPTIYKAIQREHKQLKQLIFDRSIDGVISDNRLGLYSRKVPTTIITHQLQVLSGKTTWLSSYIHRLYIQRFTECWIPDTIGKDNLTGVMGHPVAALSIPSKYIGPLSRMKRTDTIIDYDALVIISGPEPQRSLLEEMLLTKLKKFNGNVLLVRGVVEKKVKKSKTKNIEIVNFLTSTQLELAINKSKFVIARSGYSTIMDLATLQKKVFFIPTPGQPEQEYLAQRLKDLKIAPYASQDSFRIKDLAKIKIYAGFNNQYQDTDTHSLFGLFEGKGELRTNTKFTLDIHFLLVRFNNMFNDREPQT